MKKKNRIKSQWIVSKIKWKCDEKQIFFKEEKKKCENSSNVTPLLINTINSFKWNKTHQTGKKNILETTLI